MRFSTSLVSRLRSKRTGFVLKPKGFYARNERGLYRWDIRADLLSLVRCTLPTSVRLERSRETGVSRCVRSNRREAISAFLDFARNERDLYSNRTDYSLKTNGICTGGMRGQSPRTRYRHRTRIRSSRAKSRDGERMERVLSGSLTPCPPHRPWGGSRRCSRPPGATELRGTRSRRARRRGRCGRRGL